MTALRTGSWLNRAVLAWFALMLLGVAASPLVQPRTMTAVCTDSGAVRLVAIDSDGRALDAGPHAADCALCLPPSLPPSPAAITGTGIATPMSIGPGLMAAPITARARAALPPRGPPPPV